MLTRWVIIDHLGDVDDEDTVNFDLGGMTAWMWVFGTMVVTKG